jgi:hypothetical protein
MSRPHYSPSVEEFLRILARIALRRLGRNPSTSPESSMQREAGAFKPRRPYRRQIERSHTPKV